MTRIVDVVAREVLDSRGAPTVEAEVHLACGAVGRAIVPSGASTGEREAVERRDGDTSRYNGKGVLTVLASIRGEIRDRVLDLDALDQRGLDGALLGLDPSPVKDRLGANAVLAVSLANARAASVAVGLPLYRYLGGVNAHVLPVPQFNILNGGKHARDSVDIQEFMVLPVGAATFAQALQWGVEIYRALDSLLRERNLSTNVGDEGGYAPSLGANAEALELIVQAVEKAGRRPGEDVVLGVDAAAQTLWEQGDKTCYRLKCGGHDYDAAGLIEFWCQMARDFPIASIEDGLRENDWQAWSQLTARLGERLQIVGDDLLVTRAEFIGRAIEEHSANSLLVKANQVGTLTETLDSVRLAQTAGWTTVASHRSGETEDTTLADLAVAVSAGQIKTGAPARSERVAKYNRLLRIEEELGSSAHYAGAAALKGRLGLRGD